MLGLPKADHPLRGRGHQAGEIHPCAFDIGRRRHPAWPQPEQDQGAHRCPFEADALADDQDRIVAVSGDQAVEGRDLHPRHRGKRGHRFLVFVGFGKAEQGSFVQPAGAMQRQNRALRRREVAAALDHLDDAGDLAQRPGDRGLPAGLDHLEQAAPDDVDRSFQEIFQLRLRQIIALANRERQDAVMAGALDQRGISGWRKQCARVAGGAPDYVAVAAAHEDVGEIGRKRCAFRHRQ